MEHILIRLGSMESPNLDNNDVQYYYPRFLQLVLDDVLTDEEKAYFSDSKTSETPYLRTNVITSLHNRDPYPEFPTIITDFMQDCFLLMARLMLPPQHAQPNEEGNAQEPMDEQHNPYEQQYGSPIGNDSGITSIFTTVDIMDEDTKQTPEAI